MDEDANGGGRPKGQVENRLCYDELVRRIDGLEERISALEDGIDRPVEARKLSEEEIRAIILNYIPTLPASKPIYPSDIAYTFALDPDDVEEVMDALMDEGFLR